jgi:hypothetical protein
MWFNGDFPFYRALPQLAGYDYVCMMDYDALANCDFDELMSKIAEEHVDFVGYRYGPAPEIIADKLDSYYGSKNSILPCILIIRPKVIQLMLTERRRMVAMYHESGGTLGWPMFEAFLGAIVTENTWIRYAELSRYGDVSRYEWWPPNLYAPDLFASAPSFVHPVLDAPRYAKSKLMLGGDDYFVPNSQLQRDFEQLPPRLFVPSLKACFEERGERGNLFKLVKYLRTQGLSRYAFRVNLACGCPAQQSSLSPWSSGTVEQEAGRATNGPLTAYPNFHAGPQKFPWWSVDLHSTFLVNEVVIYNRCDVQSLADLFKRFSILTSIDADNWNLVFRKEDDEPVGGVSEGAFSAKFKSPSVARYVRIRNDAEEMLHLVRIEIYGEPLSSDCSANEISNDFILDGSESQFGSA